MLTPEQFLKWFFSTLFFIITMRKLSLLLFFCTCLKASEMLGINQHAENLSAIQMSYPSIAPGGNQIVFQTNLFGRWQLMLMNIDGTDVKRLTNSDSDDIQPVWSPDGSQILFVSNRSGNEDIFMLDLGSNVITQLTDNPERDIHPNWHPMKNQMIFNSNRDDPQSFELYTMDLDSLELKRITNNSQLDTYASWSPDGKHLVFIRWTEKPEASGDIYVLSDDMKTLTQITRHSAFDGWPVWLNNETIVFSSYRAEPNQLFKIKIDGSELAQLTDNDEANARAHVRDNIMVYNGAKNGMMHIYKVDLKSIHFVSGSNTGDSDKKNLEE